MPIKKFVKDIKGVSKTFFQLVQEEWEEMDHKLLKIATGIVSFLIAAAFWFFIFRRIFMF